MEKNNKQKNPKRMRGKVVSNKMQKTLVVAVDRLVAHPKYKKIMRRTQRLKAHTDIALEIGDTVTYQSCRPVSKQTHYQILEKITKEAV